MDGSEVHLSIQLGGPIGSVLTDISRAFFHPLPFFTHLCSTACASNC